MLTLEERRKWRLENLEKERLRGRKSYYKHKNKRSAQSIKWKKDNPGKVKSYHYKYYQAHKEKRKIIVQEKNKELFNEILNYYGHQCSIIDCGGIENLRVDHIGGKDNGDGYLKGHKLWRWLKKNNFPPGFRILCQRCNALDGYHRNSPFGINGIDKLIELVKNNENK
jgi:hypothetical protein